MSIDRRGRAYCRVTLDHPPINTMTATTVAELSEADAIRRRNSGLMDHRSGVFMGSLWRAFRA